MNKFPKVRSNDMVEQKLKGETLLYDLIANKVFCLNETSSIIYQACDGKTTFYEIKRKYKFTDDLIWLALDQLRKDNLIETDDSFISPFIGMSRREVIRKVGFASMIALPLIASVAAPTATMAASGGVALFGACSLVAPNCNPGLTCKSCYDGGNCPAFPGQARCCANSTNPTFARGDGWSFCYVSAATCNADGVMNCCSAMSTFVVDGCGGPGSPTYGTCTCGS